jgi:hypothetical protein
MKIQIDTTNKTIKLDSTCKIVELIDFLEKILPNEYKTYKLETDTTIIGWNNPYIYRPYRPYEVWYGNTTEYNKNCLLNQQLKSTNLLSNTQLTNVQSNILNYELVTNSL